MKGYAYVVADILHIGHLRHLQRCKKACDELIVGVLTDDAAEEKKKPPTIPYKERFEIIRGLKCVDKVVSQDTYSPLNNVKTWKPDILFESTSHDLEAIGNATRFMERVGGKVEVMPYYKGQSSTKIKCKLYESQ